MSDDGRPIIIARYRYATGDDFVSDEERQRAQRRKQTEAARAARSAKTAERVRRARVLRSEGLTTGAIGLRLAREEGRPDRPYEAAQVRRWLREKRTD